MNANANFRHVCLSMSASFNGVWTSTLPCCTELQHIAILFKTPQSSWWFHPLSWGWRQDKVSGTLVATCQIQAPDWQSLLLNISYRFRLIHNIRNKAKTPCNMVFKMSYKLLPLVKSLGPAKDRLKSSNHKNNNYTAIFLPQINTNQMSALPNSRDSPSPKLG